MEQILNDLIMLNDTELSRIDLLLVGMEDGSEKDVLEVLKNKLSENVTWFKNVKSAIDEGRI